MKSQVDWQTKVELDGCGMVCGDRAAASQHKVSTRHRIGRVGMRLANDKEIDANGPRAGLVKS
jgi:hypothetical protein